MIADCGCASKTGARRLDEVRVSERIECDARAKSAIINSVKKDSNKW